MNKISENHLTRYAYVYIRQSSQNQVKNHVESQTYQYNLREYAYKLGFKKVNVIDEDLGKSGGGSVKRDGFEKLLQAVCKGEVGAILAFEASRLARNGREWHTLLELCGLIDTLIIDPEGIYDPRLPNDRLLLGMKGTLSEMELSILKQRSQQAIIQKAKRGELLLTAATGYIKTRDNRLEKDPDKRIQEAVELIFKKFRELGSVRQVLKWFRAEEITFPKPFYNSEGRHYKWQLPVYNTILDILKNPVYAGVYAYGRRCTKTIIENGKKRKIVCRVEDHNKWKVLILDHHKCYIIWEEYQKNQEIIHHNTNMKGDIVNGSVRRGRGLLSGLLRCGHCGMRLYVAYSGYNAAVNRYKCYGKTVRNGIEKCISFGAFKVDRAIEQKILEVISPLGLQASFRAVEKINEDNDELKRHKELALEQACYEANRIQKQYNAVDPENRLVASELEKRWNEALTEVQKLEKDLKNIPEAKKISGEEKEKLLAMGEDLEYVWYNENAPIEFKKRIIRVLIKEIMVTIDNENYINLIIHWQGRDHTKIKVKKNKSGATRWKTSKELITIIQGLSRIMKDSDIASLLNRLGRRTPKGKSWTEANIRSFRSKFSIPIFNKNELKIRGELKVTQIADELNIHPRVIYRLINRKILPANQVCKGAPWIIKKEDLSKKEVQIAIQKIKHNGKIPLPDNCYIPQFYHNTLKIIPK